MSGIKQKMLNLMDMDICRKSTKVPRRTYTLNSIYVENSKNKIPKRNTIMFNKSVKDINIGKDSYDAKINERANNQIGINGKGFDTLTNERLNKMKDKMLQFLSKSKISLETQYKDYINYINNYIMENEMRLSTIFNIESKENEHKQGMISYVNKYIFKQIENLFEIHENIMSVIVDQFQLLTRFLKDFDLIFQSNPIENFVEKNCNQIMNSWLFSKVKFEKINLSDFISNIKLNDYLKQYLSKQKENKFCSVNIGKRGRENFEVEKEFLKDNIEIMQKIKFYELTADEFAMIFQWPRETKQKEAKHLKTINISRCRELKKLDFLNFKYPELEKLKIKKTQFKFNFFSLFIQLSNLTRIIMKNCSINDKNLSDFFNFCSKSKPLQSSLKVLSFSTNNLTFINMKSLLTEHGSFVSLEELNFEKNNIYSFLSDNFKSLPKLKVLNLCDNNISSSQLFNNVNSFSKNNSNVFFTFVILTNNMFITNNKKNNEEYREYLKSNILSFQHRLKTLSMSLVFNLHSSEKVADMIFSPTIKITLQKLNLSFCGLKTEILIKFLKKNFGLLSLKKINLSNNQLDNSLFSEYLLDRKSIQLLEEEKKENFEEEDNNQIEIQKMDSNVTFMLEKLESIDLSSNNFEINNDNDFKIFCDFVLYHSKLKKIKLQYNKFQNDFRKLYGNDSEMIDMEKMGGNELIDQLSSRGVILFFNFENSIIPIKKSSIIQFREKSI